MKVSTVGSVKGVKRRLFFVCSPKTPVKQKVAFREGGEGEKLNFIVVLAIFGTTRYIIYVKALVPLYKAIG